MKEIRLTQGKVAIVDDEDFESLARYRWYAWRHKGGQWYARRHTPRVDGRSDVVLMHRQITGATAGQKVDHWDRDGLHNWRGNLRVVCQSTNAFNGKMRRNNRSGVRGVYYEKRLKQHPWIARIEVDYVGIHLGCFATKEEAHAARVAAELRYFGHRPYGSEEEDRNIEEVSE